MFFNKKVKTNWSRQLCGRRVYLFLWWIWAF